MRNILKIIGLVVLLLLGIVFFVNAYNSSPAVIVGKVFKGKVFAPRVLVYRTYALGLIPVGNATFYDVSLEKLNKEEVYHLKAGATTLRIFSLFFRAQVELDSFVNPLDNNPVLFKQKIIVSGKNTSDEKEVKYDQTKGFMELAGVKREIMPNTQDPLSLIFNIKKMDFDKVSSVEFGINTNQKNYVLRGTVEKKKIGKYYFYCGKSEIKRRDKNNPYHRSKVNMWFIKEQENIPVLIKVSASGFPITVRLIEAR
jgi:hypothetical protein